jgi:hypothetical protein
VKLKIKLTEKDYEQARYLLFLRKTNIVKPEEAHEWILNNVVGEITQQELD